MEVIVISHAHGNHTRGLPQILQENRTAELHIPGSFYPNATGRKITTVEKAIQIRQEVFSTGELRSIEQALALKTERGIFVVTGCSHPRVKNVLWAASNFGKPYGIAGGFHGSRDFKALDELSLICPCHCTQYKRQIRALLKNKALGCGAGSVIEL